MRFALGCRSVCLLTWSACALVASASGQEHGSCSSLMQFKHSGVEITKASAIPAGTTVPNLYGPGHSAPLPAHCRVEGIIDRRTGTDGEQYGIRFALAMPNNWNGDFLMQGGGGSNGIVLPPLGGTAAGDTPALMRGFAVVSNDTGHQSHHSGFDFSFEKDQQAYLDFAYQANAKVAALAKEIIARYYAKPAAYSYFAGCSTGGREGMILSQRFPTAFNGIISGDPAIRTGRSNLAIGQWVPVAYNQIAPKDAQGKPVIAAAITDSDRKLIMSALLKQCDAKDGIVDGMIFNPLACHFDPTELACKDGQTENCLAPAKAAALQKAFSGPKTAEGVQVYPGFLYDSGIASTGPIPGLLVPGHGVFVPPTTAMEIDVEQQALTDIQPLVDSTATDLTTFSGNRGKLIFYHGDSDPWFSPLDTLNYYKDVVAANGGLEAVSKWSQFYFVPGMSHCGGGSSLDNFDLLSSMVEWVEKGVTPKYVVSTGKAFPGRSRPLCPFPTHAQYKGSGDPQEANSFACQE